MTARPAFGRTVPGNRWDLLDGERPETAPTVSVVVVHYRQQGELDRTLAALARQTHPADRLEVIVVDDGSPEAPTVPAGVRLLVQPDEGFRLSAARNLGVRESTGEVLCFLDADTAPEPEYIERLVRLPALLPEAVTVGRRRHARLSDLPSDAPVESLAPGVELPEPEWLQAEYSRTSNLVEADQRSYRFMIGAVIACSRWLFDEVGGFDESIRDYGGEDWEWAHRAWLEGAVFAHEPDAVAWHDGPEWAERSDAADRSRKNAETLRLIRRIPVAGSRGWGLRSSAVDVLAHLADAPSSAAAFVCVDSLLAALPHATVVVPDAVHDTFSGDARVRRASDPGLSTLRPRVIIEIPTPVRLSRRSAALRDVAEEVGSGDLGTVLLRSDDGVGVRVTSRRAELRRSRWTTDAFRTEERPAPGMRAVPDEPELAAYLGGWDDDAP